MADKIATRYYELPPGTPAGEPIYFSVGDGGRYERWDRDAEEWVHVTSDTARDFYSRAVESGEGIPTTLEAVH